MADERSIFDTLNSVDVSSKVRQKNNLSYLSWSDAWTEVKKKYPNATYRIIPQYLDGGNTRFWHDDGKTGWVEVGVTINGIEHIEVLAIMDFKNKSLAAEEITSVDANKSKQRCLVKACAMHGLGLFVYSGEDMPEEIAKVLDIQNEITELATKKCALSEKAKNAAIELCKNAEKEANPNIPDDLITGKVSNINDIAVLENLKLRLLAVRK